MQEQVFILQFFLKIYPLSHNSQGPLEGAAVSKIQKYRLPVKNKIIESYRKTHGNNFYNTLEDFPSSFNSKQYHLRVLYNF